MSKKFKFKIGDWVEFKSHIRVISTDGQRYAYEVGMARPKKGQICGAITRFMGEIKTHDWDFHNDHAFLEIRKSITLYQIKEGMINVPFEAREEDITKLKFCTDVLPWKYVPYSDFERQQAREQAMSQPRDSKGRFVRHVLKAVGE